jgi:hypothetical protein
MAVEMIASTKRITPHRRTEFRETTSDFYKPKQVEAKSSPKPRELEPVYADYEGQTYSSESVDLITDLSTDAKGLKSRFDMPLPKPMGANIEKPGTGSVRRSSDGNTQGGAVGVSDGAEIFETALYWISRNIVGKNKTGKEDIVFIIDASGSMEENIASVSRHLNKMIDVFKESDLDYTVGIIEFKRILKNNDIRIHEQTQDIVQIRSVLRSIVCDGDERALDAIEIGLKHVKFRPSVDKTFILVTDETFTRRTITRQTRKDISARDMLQEDIRDITRMCQEKEIKVNVLGLEDKLHKSLAKETGGLWFQIPKPDEKL